MPRMPYENPQPEQPDPKKKRIDEIMAALAFNSQSELAQDIYKITGTTDQQQIAQLCLQNEHIEAAILALLDDETGFLPPQE